MTNRNRSASCCFFGKLCARIILLVRDTLGTILVLFGNEGESERTDAANCIWNPLTWSIITNVIFKNLMKGIVSADS